MVEGNRTVFGYTTSISSGTSPSFTFIFPGTTSNGVYLHKLKINAPGVSADTALYGYDGTSGTSNRLILGGAGSTAGSAVPLAAQPDEGFIFDDRYANTPITTGSMTILVLNNTQNSKNVYVAGEYTY